MTESSHFDTSDKITWHRYMEFYEPHLARLGGAANILEFGVFHGASIRYLHDRYPDAHIVGCDILPTQADWPESERIEYVRLDQGRIKDLQHLFEEHPGPFDLVIEDGSHAPAHQRNCLVAAAPHVREEGVYILEDLHTSHPDHPTMRGRNRKRTNAYHLLLALEHLLAMGGKLTDAMVAQLTRNSLLMERDVRDLYARIASVQLYRRAVLPIRCYRCDSADFAYDRLRCVCGVNLLETADSISAILTIRSA